MINNRPSADLLLPRSLTALFSWTHSVGYSPKCFGGGVRPELRNQSPINDQNWLFSYRFSDLSEQSVLNFRHLNYYTKLLPFAHFRLRRATNLPMTMMRKKGKFLNWWPKKIKIYPLFWTKTAQNCTIPQGFQWRSVVCVLASIARSF